MHDDQYERFSSDCEKILGRCPPSSERISEEMLSSVKLVLRRLALAQALHSDEAFSDINRSAGYFEDTALRLYLLLTCVELVGRLRKPPFRDFRSWIGAKKNASPARTHILADRLSKAPIATNEQALELVIGLHDAYLAEHGFRTYFLRFFTEQLDDNVRLEIATKIWVYRGDPAFAGSIFVVEEGYWEAAERLQPLVTARAAWDALPTDDRILKIARACEKIRNDYTHGLVPRIVSTDKDHRAPVYPVLAALRSSNIRVVARAEYDAVGTGGMGFNNVSCKVRDGVLFVLENTIDGKSIDEWADTLIRHYSVPVSRGHDLVIDNKIILGVQQSPLTAYLRRWIASAMCNVLSGEPG